MPSQGNLSWDYRHFIDVDEDKLTYSAAKTQILPNSSEIMTVLFSFTAATYGTHARLENES